MIRKISIVTLCIVLTLSLSACMNISLPKDKETDVVENSTINSEKDKSNSNVKEEIKENKNKEGVNNSEESNKIEMIKVKEGLDLNRKVISEISRIVTYLTSDSSDNLEDYFYYPENAFFVSENRNKILSLKGLDSIDLYSFDEFSIDSYEVDYNDKTIAKVCLKATDNTVFDLYLKNCEDGKYRVYLDDLFIKDISLRIPTNSAVKMDGVDISSYKSKSSDGQSIYVFGGFVPGTYLLEYDSTILSGISQSFEITKKDAGSLKELNYNLTAIEAQEFLPYATELYRNVIEKGLSDGTSGIKKYFADSFDVGLLNKIGSDMRKNLNVLNTPILNKTDITDIVKYPSVLESDNQLKFWFKFETTFEQKGITKPIEVCTMSDGVWMGLTKTEEGYKIYGISDNCFLKEYYSWTNNWSKY